MFSYSIPLNCMFPKCKIAARIRQIASISDSLNIKVRSAPQISASLMMGSLNDEEELRVWKIQKIDFKTRKNEKV